ncbi:ABC transporter, ATP-binding protein [[Clostridium] hylemonae DSM 15053]|uniref:ABC transporter, ATP-binding protein n=2 Tax=[Clostridium] hylemonae TaxID=89153 RepID=C0C4E4_9FIRM|nr:ABC transporter, ATP-binding protein [[Clostridium] hylemonae DSM 15053]
MINVTDLSFAYESSYDNIFEHVSFQIDTDWKLGFIGRNGRGKTTFLKLLLGKYEYDGTISASVEFEYFPYEVKDAGRMTVEIVQEMKPQAQVWEIMRELNLMEVAEDVLYREFDTLSHGERTKVMLAALFLGSGRFLLIDEPTNHLDTKARAEVAAYLNRKKGFILVSHDRHFLDACVDHILSINKMDIEVQKGNFTTWYTGKEARDRMEAAQNEKLRSEIKRLTKAARQSENWSDKVEKTKKGERVAGLRPDRGAIGHKAAKMMKRSKVLEKRQHMALEEKSKLLKNIDFAETLRLEPLAYHAHRLAELQDVAVRYGEREVCRGVSFEICRGDRICLSGRNGCGKSSILKLLLGEDIPHTGQMQTGSGIKISYVPQDTSHLRGTLKELASEYAIEESLFKMMLRKLDLERVQFEKDIADYSAGQKKKVLLAKSLCEQAHLYVWDEPLNYIDVLSRLQIEELIQNAGPTMIFVEHDEAFREKIATKVCQL